MLRIHPNWCSRRHSEGYRSTLMPPPPNQDYGTERYCKGSYFELCRPTKADKKSTKKDHIQPRASYWRKTNPPPPLSQMALLALRCCGNSKEYANHLYPLQDVMHHAHHLLTVFSCHLSKMLMDDLSHTFLLQHVEVFALQSRRLFWHYVKNICTFSSWSQIWGADLFQSFQVSRW